MISKAQIKNIRLLHQKKYRDKQGLFVAEGPKVVIELLRSSFKVKDIYCLEELISSFSAFTVQKVSEKELQSISAFTSANQVLATFEMRQMQLRVDTMKDQLILALDDIRDPGNLGTIIRIADWFGINHILCSESCVDLYNPKVIQSTMGSIGRVSIYSVDLEMILKDFHPVYAAALGGKNIYLEKLSSTGVILIGNESKGISEKLMPYVNNRISIPGFGISNIKAESLNAAIATAVICSEFRRR